MMNNADNMDQSDMFGEDNVEEKRTIKIKRKHLIAMLEKDKNYRNSDLLYNCYLA